MPPPEASHLCTDTGGCRPAVAAPSPARPGWFGNLLADVHLSAAAVRLLLVVVYAPAGGRSFGPGHRSASGGAGPALSGGACGRVRPP